LISFKLQPSTVIQTFLPFPSFAESAAALDYRRLGKQRVECKQIMLALIDPTYGWQNHPAVKMWRGHVRALADYATFICLEWKSRGYKDTLAPWFIDFAVLNKDSEPPWLGAPDFHRSHQSNLIRKDPAFYAPKFPGVPGDLPYIWPAN